MKEATSDLSSPTTSILIDNSTYFSFRSLFDAGYIDGDSLFNSANFAECLLLSDEVLTSPSVAWAPDDSDPLYATGQPCKQMSFSHFNEHQLRDLFSIALATSLTDIHDNRGLVPITSGLGAEQAANLLLESWSDLVREDFRFFLSSYPEAVFHHEG